MKKRILLILIIVVVLVGVIVGVTVVMHNNANKPLSAAELLNLGEKYLLEMDYEQALVQFLKAIEVEPMNPRGYIGAAEAYVGLGDFSNEVFILRQGSIALPDNSEISKKLTELRTASFSGPDITTDTAPESSIEPEIFPESKIEALSEMQLFLRDLLAQYEVNEYDSVYESVNTVEYQILIENEKNYPVIYSSKSDSYGIGLYCHRGGIDASGNEVVEYFLYIGDYIGGQRSGYGVWFMLTHHYGQTYRFEGEWERDMPNGFGNEISGQLDMPEYKQMISGALVDGYWDGKIIIKNNWPTESNAVFLYDKGKSVVIGEKKDVNSYGEMWYPVEYDQSDETYYLYIHESSIYGLRGIDGCI